MKKWLIIAVSIAVVVAAIAVVCMICNNGQYVYIGSDGKQIAEPKIEENAWQPYKAIDLMDSTHVYKVSWSPEANTDRVMYCRAVFRNDKEKQYRLIAPWLDGVDIERPNMDDIQFDKVLISSLPEGALSIILLPSRGLDIDYSAEDFSFFVQKVCEPLGLTTLKQIIVALKNNPRLIRQYIRDISLGHSYETSGIRVEAVKSGPQVFHKQLFHIMYEIPLEEVPLYVNDDPDVLPVVHWRLEIAK